MEEVMSDNWYLIKDDEVDIEREGYDLTESEPRKAYVSINLSFKEVEQLYQSIKEEQE
jgi:hypothetical protein